MAANESSENGELEQTGIIAMLSDDCLALILSYVATSKEDIAAVCAALPLFEAASKSNIVWRQLLNMDRIRANVDAQFERKASFPPHDPGHFQSFHEVLSRFTAIQWCLEMTSEARGAVLGFAEAGFHFENQFGIDCINNSTDLVVSSDPNGIGGRKHAKEMGETLSWTTRKSATMVFVWDALRKGKMKWRQQPIAEVTTEILGEDGQLWLLELISVDSDGGHYTAIEIPVDGIAAACATPDGKLYQAYQAYRKKKKKKKKKVKEKAASKEK